MIKFSFAIIRCIIAFIIIMWGDTLFYGLSYADSKLNPNSRYKIIRPVYLVGVYKSLNNKQLSKETALAYLEAKRSYKKSEVAFQDEVQTGTIMTIIGSAPKVWHLFFLPNRYFVKFDPDLSRGLDIIIELDRGIEGDLDGLNSEIFSRLEY